MSKKLTYFHWSLPFRILVISYVPYSSPRISIKRFFNRHKQVVSAAGWLYKSRGVGFPQSLITVLLLYRVVYILWHCGFFEKALDHFNGWPSLRSPPTFCWLGNVMVMYWTANPGMTIRLRPFRRLRLYAELYLAI